jgi:Flp pilus assembly protein TadD
LNLGYALRSVGQLDEATTNINKAIALDPSLASPGATPAAPNNTPAGDATPAATP